MQIYLAVTPAEAQEASRFPLFLAHVAHCIGPDSTLLRQNLLPRPGRAIVRHRPGRALYRQPGAAVGRRAAGVRAAELWRRTAGFRAASCAGPAGLCRRRWPGACRPRPVYVPESYAAASGAIPLICTAISGGNFVQRLQEAAAGRDRAGGLALDVQRLRMDFTLPAQSGEGPSQRPGTPGPDGPGVPLRFLLPGPVRPVFHLCPDGETHFVLFDDADTLSQKLRTGGTWASPPPS